MQFNLALALLLASGSLAVLAAPMPQQQDDRNGLVANVDKTVNDPLTMVRLHQTMAFSATSTD